MDRRGHGRALPLLLVVLLVGAAAGYLVLSARPVRAGDIRRDPKAFAGRAVTVVGSVSGSASIGGELLRAFGGGGGFFLLDDGTGMIGVTVQGPAPSKGRKVRVRGKVELLASLSIPDAWVKGFTGGGGSGDLTAVVLKAESVSEF